MKRTLLLTCLSALILTIQAQTNYYTETKIFYENGYTYQCYVEAKWVDLYNKNYTTYAHGRVTQVFKDTGETFYLLHYERVAQMYDNDETRENGKNKVRAILAPYKSILKDKELLMKFVINSDTGKIDEVYFGFTQIGPYAQLPISVFREIELSLIGTQFKLTDFGKRLNYLYMWWAVAP